MCGVASHMLPAGALGCNTGMRPDRESNWQPFASQAGTQTTEPHQPMLLVIFVKSLAIGIGTSLNQNAQGSPQFLSPHPPMN